MRRMNVNFWYNVAMALLLMAVAGDVFFGLDAVLNGISTLVFIAVSMAILGLVGTGVVALLWIVVRDIVEDLAFDRRNFIAWRWRLLGYAGMAGILIDGVVGAWNAYQEHILFATAVEQIPFAGLPVLLALASYPAKWFEQYWMRKQKERDKPYLYASSRANARP